MAEGVAPEIAAALVKLAQQDAWSVGGAAAALEWIVGELGLATPAARALTEACLGRLPGHDGFAEFAVQIWSGTVRIRGQARRAGKTASRHGTRLTTGQSRPIVHPQ